MIATQRKLEQPKWIYEKSANSIVNGEQVENLKKFSM